MADSTTEIDLDSVIDRLLEGATLRALFFCFYFCAWRSPCYLFRSLIAPSLLPASASLACHLLLFTSESECAGMCCRSDSWRRADLSAVKKSSRRAEAVLTALEAHGWPIGFWM